MKHWRTWAVLTAALIVAVLSAGGRARAHDHYPSACCSGRDCEPFPVDAMVETATGYEVAWYSQKRGFLIQGFVPLAQARVSQDGGFHICASRSRIICLFIPSNI